MFVDGHIQKNDLSRQLEILLPSSSEQPFAVLQRKYLTAVDALQMQPKIVSFNQVHYHPKLKHTPHRLNTTITTQEHPTAQVHSQVHVKMKKKKTKPKKKSI
ncbi:hypothetical protein QTN25_010736 [Entamoeba marina]